MRLKGLFATAAAAALLTATTAGAAAPVANPAAGLSVARAATPGAHDSGLGADVPTGTLISIGILAALIVIVLVATNGGGDNATSP